jgi:hypothetical protein
MFAHDPQPGDTVRAVKRNTETGKFVYGARSESVTARLIPPHDLPLKDADARPSTSGVRGSGGTGRPGADDNKIERIVHEHFSPVVQSRH